MTLPWILGVSSARFLAPLHVPIVSIVESLPGMHLVTVYLLTRLSARRLARRLADSLRLVLRWIVLHKSWLSKHSVLNPSANGALRTSLFRI